MEQTVVMQQNWGDYAVIAVYMAVVLGIGFYFSKGENTAKEYLLGGKRLPVLAVALSCVMTMLSSISIVMVPGEIYNYGFTLFALNDLFCWMAIPAYLIFVRFYFKLGSFTPYEYLEYRYTPGIRTLVAVGGFYSRTLYIGMVLYTTSKIFQGAYGWEPSVTILLVGVVGVAYTVMGGMKAVVWTDVLQFFFLAGGLIVIVTVLCLNVEGGPVEAVLFAWREGHGVPQFRDPDFYKITPYTRLLFFLLLYHAVIGPIGQACGNQIKIQRLLSTKDWQAGLKSEIISVLVSLALSLPLLFIGFALVTYYHQNPDPVIAKLGGDAVFFRFVSTKLPSPLPGLFMAAMLAAIMSTLDSGINSMATVYLKEFHCRYFNKNMDDAQQVRVSKYATLIVGAVSVALALGLNYSGKWLQQSVSEVRTIFGILAVGTLPAFLFAVLSRRANAGLIWGYTFFSTGEAITKNVWYALSRSSLQAYQRDPSLGFGWAGKLEWEYFLVPFLLGVLVLLPWFSRKLKERHPYLRITCALISLVILGGALGMLQWCFFSNLYIEGEPLARSFAFHLPLSLLGSFAILWFCPVQPEEKWRGLTIATVNERVLSRD